MIPARQIMLKCTTYAYLVEEDVELDGDGPDNVEDGEGQRHERRERPEELGQPGGALPGHLEDHVL